ncbi:MAG TPA: M28 family peptidase [Clostridia bacterium]|nr:M28 family peptidase [Clostridia bacterium]
MRRTLVVLLSVLLCVGAASAQKTKRHSKTRAKAQPKIGSLPVGAAAAMQSVSADRIRADVRFLSSDLLEGRGTGARGGDLAAQYIATQFALAGLKPAGDDGGFLQKVPMVGVSTKPESTLEISTGKGEPMKLRLLEDMVLMNESQLPTADVSGDVVFVGYGITAPEYNWDDYAGINVKGKVLLMFVNEPPSQNENFFKGKALTYYGRWTYKFEHAAEMGAAGVILVHKADMASYGWNVVRNSWSGERSSLRDDPSPKLPMSSWIQLELARKVLADAGQDLDKLLQAAGQPGFKPIPLPVKVTAHIVSSVRPFESQNVVGVLEGSDPELKKEGVIYTAHYDHLGIRPDIPGDNIYNGALDNATGTAMIIEMARAAATSQKKPKRSLYFAAVTAEEQGLCGSEYLGKHPPIPADRISLNLNFDSIAPLGIPKQVSAGGYDRTNFAPIFDKTASDFGFKILAPGRPEAGGYYRSDHFSFARVGVPAFSVNTGEKYEGQPEEWVNARRQEMGKNYHEPNDEFRDDFDYRADAVMARFGLALGYKAAELPTMVQWKSGDEFEAKRKPQVGSK